VGLGFWRLSVMRFVLESGVIFPPSLKTRVGGVVMWQTLRLTLRVREWWWRALPSVTQNMSGRGGGDVADPPSRVSCMRVVVVGRVSPPSLKTRVVMWLTLLRFVRESGGEQSEAPGVEMEGIPLLL